ncbi:COG2426 family protein [Chloroflexota bacterium]
MDLSDILAVVAIAASPISELRGAIPVAVVLYHFPWYYALLFSIIGNLIPVPFILLFLNVITKLLSKTRFSDRLLQRFITRIRRKGKAIERYERIGLALFVAIPLPITGAWTGSILAVLLGLKFRYAFLSILAGVLAAGVVVTCATLLGWSIVDLLVAQGI